MSNRPTGEQGGTRRTTATATNVEAIVDETADKDADVLALRGRGYAEYQEARRQLRERNARARARRGGR
jgi:hypothetical protein